MPPLPEEHLGHVTTYSAEIEISADLAGMSRKDDDRLEGIEIYFSDHIDISDYLFESIMQRIIRITWRFTDAKRILVNISEDRFDADIVSEDGVLLTSIMSRIYASSRLGSGYSTSVAAEVDLDTSDKNAGKISPTTTKSEFKKSSDGAIDADLRDRLGLSEDAVAAIAEDARRRGLTPVAWVTTAIKQMLEGKKGITSHFHKATNRILQSAPGGAKFATHARDGEDIVAFLKRVYEEPGFLTGTFTRLDLRKIDPDAVIALETWEQGTRTRPKGRAPLKLPTRTERNNELRNADPDTLTDAEKLARNRLLAIQKYQAKRTSPDM